MQFLVPNSTRTSDTRDPVRCSTVGRAAMSQRADTVVRRWQHVKHSSHEQQTPNTVLSQGDHEFWARRWQRLGLAYNQAQVSYAGGDWTSFWLRPCRRL